MSSIADRVARKFMAGSSLLRSRRDYGEVSQAAPGKTFVIDEIRELGRKAKSCQDYESYLDSMRSALGGHGYQEEILAELEEGKVFLFAPKNLQGRKRLLLMSGMHGEEPAAPWGLLNFCKENQELLDSVAISILPIVSPHGFKTGFKTGDRAGEDGCPVNRVFNLDGTPRCVGDEDGTLYESRNRLAVLARDGMLTMHEDVDANGFYIYVFGDIGCGTVKGMQEAGLGCFRFQDDGAYDDNGHYEIKGGLVDNHRDGTFDDVMSRISDIPLIITSETPAGNGFDFGSRVAAGSAMAKAFVLGASAGKV